MIDQPQEPVATTPQNDGVEASTESSAEQPASETHNRAVSAASEARRYRKRAQAAEKTLEDIKATLAQREKTIAQHEQTIKDLEQRRAIDQALREARALDVEAAVAKAPGTDVATTVRELQRTSPHLFSASRRASGAGALAPKPPTDASPQRVAATRAAAEATSSGRRSDLLRYLRLRRQ